MFRTPTGQTGATAYLYEAAQIANAQRELDARAARLADAMTNELPADWTGRMAIPSKRFPDATTAIDASGLRHWIKCQSSARFARNLVNAARTIAHPNTTPLQHHPDAF